MTRIPEDQQEFEDGFLSSIINDDSLLSKETCPNTGEDNLYYIEEDEEENLTGEEDEQTES